MKLYTIPAVLLAIFLSSSSQAFLDEKSVYESIGRDLHILFCQSSDEGLEKAMQDIQEEQLSEQDFIVLRLIRKSVLETLNDDSKVQKLLKLSPEELLKFHEKTHNDPDLSKNAPSYLQDPSIRTLVACGQISLMAKPITAEACQSVKKSITRLKATVKLCTQLLKKADSRK